MLRLSLLATLALASELSGQSGDRRRARPNPGSTQASVRAELAAVLLESGKYSEARREYYALVNSDGRNYAYRLGLARTLTWGGWYRDAETQLNILESQRPGDPVIEELRRLVRPNLYADSREVRRWVAERPNYAPYRIQLARALLREGQARAAVAEYVAVLTTNPSPALLREAGEAFAAARDRSGGVAYVSGFVARAPADTGYRAVLVDALLADRQYAAAVAQADTVVLLARTPATLAMRARVNIARGDLGAAERDLNESLGLRPSAETYLLLGDTYRWRGEFGRARTAYAAAGTLKRDRALTAAFAQLARDERGVFAFEPPPVTEAGWHTTAGTNGDNAGIYYSTLEVRRGVGLAYGFVGGVSAEVRQLRETRSLAETAIGGYAVDVAVAREGIRGPFYGRGGVSAGLAFHPQAKLTPAAGLSFTGRYFAWSASYDLATGAAYPFLRTLASIIPFGTGSEPLTMVTNAVSLGGPLGRADVAAGLRTAALSDDNSRTEFQGYARFPFTPNLSAVYAGSSISFAERSTRYWAPSSYASNALGLELAARQLRGWSLVARALPGVALTDDSPFVAGSASGTGTRRSRFQITTGGELAYRHPRWESALAVGWGRVASYSRAEVSGRISVVP